MTSHRDFVAAIDQGTSGTKCFVFDVNGRVVAKEARAHSQYYPHPGWVEHDPLEIWSNTKKVVRGALAKARITGRSLAAVGVTNQRETVIAWDSRTGKPFYNAIVWQDARTAERCNQLSTEGSIRQITGLFPHPYFSATKLEWLLKNVQKLEQARKNGTALLGTVDSWLLWNLTRPSSGSGTLTDQTNASRTMLMDIRKRRWSEEMLELLHIPASMMPEIRSSSGRDGFGFTSKAGPFGAEVPVAGDIGDQQAALVGQACFNEGDTKCTYGTGAFMLRGTGETPVWSRNGLLTTVGYSFGKRTTYALEGSIASAGSVLTWLRKNLGMVKSVKEVESLAKSLAMKDSGGVYFVPAFSGLYSPYWDPTARGVIVGLTQFTRKEHLARAALEGICWQTRDVYEAMVSDTGVKSGGVRVDGGGAKSDFLMQMQADVLGVEVVRPQMLETTALGAAFCAGLSLGLWTGEEELSRLVHEKDKFSPAWDEARRDEGYGRWRLAVARARGWTGDDAGTEL